jgi:outer membrane lipoprotein-sorting protein/nucleotide-binding universal stress UspA family protein
MNGDDAVELCLVKAGEALRARPSVAAAVMARLDGETLVSAPPVRRRRRWLLAATALAVVSGGIALLFGGRPALAFEEVRAAIRKVNTVVAVVEKPGRPESGETMYAARGQTAMRVVRADGLVRVMSTTGRMLLLNDSDKTASLQAGPVEKEGEAFIEIALDRIANVEREAVESVGSRVEGGRTLYGFRIRDRRAAEIAESVPSVIWVDGETRLPVRTETLRRDPRDEFFAGQEEIVRWRFDEPLPDSLFSLAPPAGYRLVEANEFRGPTPAAPAGDLDEKLVVHAGEGIGAARFGMSKDEIVAIFGTADQASPYRKHTPEEEKAIEALQAKAEAEGWDGARLAAEMNKAASVQPEEGRGWDGWLLHYYGLGMQVSIANDGGMSAVMCMSRKLGFLHRDFAGRTAEGVSLSSSVDEVIAAYGKPDARSSDTLGDGTRLEMLQYRTRGLSFDFRDGDMGMMIVSRGDGEEKK